MKRLFIDHMKRTKVLAVLLPAIFLNSCNKFVETPAPTNAITSAAVFSTDAGITSALTGAYDILAQNSTNATVEPALFADELTEPNAFGQDIQSQNNTYNSGVDYGFFTNYYQVIYQANDIILSLTQPGAISDATAKQAIGEAYFLRAFCYFKLANFYGSVPLVVTTNVNVTALQTNTPVTAIYTAMISDLTKATSLVASGYPAAQKIRVNKLAVTAMLAKVYLYNKQWVDAEAAATMVINSGTYSLESDLNNVFVVGSNETIWQFYNSKGYTFIGGQFLPYDPTNLNFVLRTGLVNAFEGGDQRKSAWTQPGSGLSSASYYPFKYKQNNNASGATAEYEVQLRLGELYLIRAEARAEQINLNGGLSDINIIRNRAGLANVTSTGESDLLLKIEQERRIELMFEESNRWFDLNRTGRTAYWLTPIKPTFISRAVLLPYPIAVIQANPNIVQNPGY